MLRLVSLSLIALGEEAEKAVILIIIVRLFAKLLQLLLFELFVFIHSIFDLEAVFENDFKPFNNLHNVIVLSDDQLSIFLQVSDCLWQLKGIDVLTICWTLSFLLMFLSVGRDIAAMQQVTETLEEH